MTQPKTKTKTVTRQPPEIDRKGDVEVICHNLGWSFTQDHCQICRNLNRHNLQCMEPVKIDDWGNELSLYSKQYGDIHQWADSIIFWQFDKKQMLWSVRAG